MRKIPVLLACLAGPCYGLRVSSSDHQASSMIARTSSTSSIEPQGAGLIRLGRGNNVTDSGSEWLQHVATLQVAGTQLSLIAADMPTAAMIWADEPVPPTRECIWDSGVALATLLGDDPTIAGKRVLELGSGTGVAGLSAAAAGADVVLTDLIDDIPLLNTNIARNLVLLKGRAVASVLPWGVEASTEIKALGPFDLICGSDLLYSPTEFDNLLRTLIDLSTPGKTEVLLTYPMRIGETSFLHAATDCFEKVETYEVKGFDRHKVGAVQVGPVWCTRFRRRAKCADRADSQLGKAGRLGSIMNLMRFFVVFLASCSEK